MEESTQHMYLCPSCGIPLNFGERFCGNCGAALNWSIQMPFQSVPPTFTYQRQNPSTIHGQQFSSHYSSPQEPERTSYGNPTPPVRQPIIDDDEEYKPKKKGSRLGMTVLMVFLCFLFTGAAVTFATNGTIITSLLKNNQPVYKLPVGEALSTDAPPPVVTFSASPSSITPGQTAVLTWNVTGANSVSIDQGVGTVPASGTRQVTPSKTTTYVLTAAGVSSSKTASASVTVTSAAQQATISFSANPTTIAAGQSATLQWNVPGAISVVIEPDIGNVAESGNMMVTPAATVTYTLTASISTGSQSASTTVIVAAGALPTINKFIANPASISIGQASILQWDVSGAESVSIDQGVGNVSATGSKPVTPGATAVYTLTATGPTGSVSATATVNISSTKVPVISTFAIDPNNINSGQTTTIRWNVSGAASIYIYPDIGAAILTQAGAKTIAPVTSTTYTIVATNSAGSSTQSTTVIVAPPGSPVVTTFISNPGTIKTGEHSTLIWSVTGADSIAIALGTDNTSTNVTNNGAIVVSPSGTTTYSLTATNSAGVITAQTTVYVTTDELSLMFKAEPGYINAGQSSTLQWHLIGADTVFVDQGIGESASSASVIVTPPITTVYTLTSNTIILKGTVVVVQPGSPLIEYFTADPTEITSGGDSTLQWSIPGASAVSINPGIGAVSSTGVQRVSPDQTTTYTIMAVNNNGYVYKSVTVTVQ